MAYIKHSAETSKAELLSKLQDIENPGVELLNKRLADLDQVADAADIVRIHNGMVKAIEDLNKRVSELEKRLNA
jgi:flagellar hook-associated protein FlgK